ncbi:uncharacterized protein LOC134227685 [Armigeres subalbatus]|uniref:uncharacterized protein LOC134227685 n=1 Tax=Armigeres subalbatus TaxID=124917 RepID=UPI002ED07A3C
MENFVAAGLSIPTNTNANVIVLNEPYSSSQTVCPRASMAYDENCEPTITQQTTSQKIQNVSLVQHAKPSVNSHMIEATLIHPQASALLPVQHNTNSCTLTSQVNQIHVPADQLPTSSKIIRGTSPEQTVLGDGKGYLQDENMFYQYADENNTSALQITGSMSYEQMKADLKVFIETTVTKSVEKAFETNFARYAALSDIEARENSAKSEDDIVENHTLINNEDELSKWNIKLNSRHLRQRFLEYFAKIIIPNAYIQKGDNACYTVVNCLFTRDFWTKMTWTGISRGNKTKRGFREYGNVIQLLGDIVRIGDPSYTAQKLELFCRNKLFRYCKPRSTCQKLRKSACRPKRSHKAAAISAGDGHNTDHEDPPSSDDDERMAGDESNFESDDEECDGNTSMDSD